MNRREIAARMEALSMEVAQLAAAIERIPRSAPLGGQAHKAAADLEQIAEGLADPEWED